MYMKMKSFFQNSDPLSLGCSVTLCCRSGWAGKHRRNYVSRWRNCKDKPWWQMKSRPQTMGYSTRLSAARRHEETDVHYTLLSISRGTGSLISMQSEITHPHFEKQMNRWCLNAFFFFYIFGRLVILYATLMVPALSAYLLPPSK